MKEPQDHYIHNADHSTSNNMSQNGDIKSVPPLHASNRAEDSKKSDAQSESDGGIEVELKSNHRVRVSGKIIRWVAVTAGFVAIAFVSWAFASC